MVNRFDSAKLADVTVGLAASTIRQFHLVIQDVAIERRLAQIPELREAQFCSLLLQVHNSTEATRDIFLYFKLPYDAPPPEE